MRASAACIQGPLATKKRKAKDVEFRNKVLCLSNSSNAKNVTLGADSTVTIEDLEKSDDTISMSPHFLSPSLSITRRCLEMVVDTLKKSAKRIFHDSSLWNDKKPILKDSKTFQVRDNKENIAPSRKLNEPRRVLLSSSKKYIQKPFSIGSTMIVSPNIFSPIVLKSKIGLDVDQDWIMKNCDGKNCNITLPSVLQNYLKERKYTLFRSRTESQLSKHAIVNFADIEKFSLLIEEDPLISLFIKRDICRRYADKYLLCMVFAYFIRAQLEHKYYNRENFFAALYLAHDMEEEDEDLKFEVFPYCLGPSWRSCYTYLLSLRDDLFWAVNCRAVVSRKCCEQIMKLMPDHWMWQRDRPDYHADIIRDVDSKAVYPKGPYGSPIWCRSCLETECYESENSYLVYSSHSDLSDGGENENLEPNTNVGKDSGFESFLIDQNEIQEGDKENSDPNNNNVMIKT